MRAFPRPSLVWLAAAPAVLAALACTPSLSLEDRPPPCVTGYAPCPTTGLCVRPESMDLECPYALVVRQGGDRLVAVPGASAADVSTVEASSDDFTVTTVAGTGGVFVKVAAAHGTPLGEAVHHVVTITARVGGQTYVREIPILVSPIAASPTGADNAAGTTDKPFRTFFQAAKVAGPRDTIILQNDKNGSFSEPGETRVVVLPADVIVQGQGLLEEQDRKDNNIRMPNEITRTKIAMPLELSGGVTLKGLQISQRLTFTAPHANVDLQNVELMEGLSVTSDAIGTTLSLSGKSHVLTSFDPASPFSPFVVDADDATVTIRGSFVEYLGRPILPTMELTGQGATLNIFDDASVKNSLAPVAIRVAGTSTVDFDGHDLSVLILGRVEVLAGTSEVHVKKTSFALAQDAGGILFKGSFMEIADSEFMKEGIVQNNPASTVIVRGTSFSDYTRVGCQLSAGRLNLGTATDGGYNVFRPSHEMWLGMVPPTALLVDAESDGTTGVTSSITTYDNIQPDAQSVMGPKAWPGIYNIAHEVPITFF